MSAVDLHTALLRPAVLQILKAVGFGAASSAVVDSLTDLAARYILLLASEAVEVAVSNHDNLVLTVQDVRLAMTRIGALAPQMSVTEEAARGEERVGDKMLPFEDLRGVKAFIEWSQGTLNAEIRRVAGVSKSDSHDVADLAAGLDDSEDYVSGEQSSTLRRFSMLIFLQQSRRNIARPLRTHVTKALYLAETVTCNLLQSLEVCMQASRHG